MIKRFPFNLLQTNCYVISDDTKQCAIVDCGAMKETELTPLYDYLKEEQLEVVVVLQTHGHFDHIWGDSYLYNKFGLLPRLHIDDVSLFNSLSDQVLQMLKINNTVPSITVGDTFVDGDVICLGHQTLRVLHTPGHTPGGVCFYNEKGNYLLSGDTLFFNSVGRTDFPGGDALALYRSINDKLLPLNDSVIVYPGHGPTTTIGNERRWF